MKQSILLRGSMDCFAEPVIGRAFNVAHYGRNAADKVSKTLVERIKDKDKPVMTEVAR